jgi:hypothetical protein
MRDGMNIRDLNGVETSTAQFSLIGYTVFWRLAGIRVSHSELDQALQATGFRSYLPDPPTPRVALRRALECWLREKIRPATQSNWPDEESQDENDGRKQRTLIRVINRAGSEHLVYALVAEDVDFSRLGLSYGTALRILLHKKTGAMICTTDAEGVIDAQRESQQVADELAPYWRQYRDLFIARDLSQMMRQIIDGLNAVHLRRAGGVYFVPASGREPLVRLRQLIANIPQIAELEPFVCALGVPDAVETKRSLSKAVHAGLLDEIDSLQSDLRRISENGDHLREKTITQRLLNYKRLKAKAEMYQDLLDMRQDQVRAGIVELECEARRLLTSTEVEPFRASTAHFSALPFAEAELAAA